MDSVSKDMINVLPDALLCHILSYLTTKEAASTSLLSRRWRYLLAFVPNLEFDDSVFLHRDKRVKNPLREKGLVGFVLLDGNNKRKKLSTSFPDFVDRILDLQGNSPLDKFSLKMVDGHDPVDPDSVVPWIHKVLVRGVSDLQLVVDMNGWTSDPLPSRIFLSETLVKLTIKIRDGPFIDVKHVHLPKLKTLYLRSVVFDETDIGFSKLLSGCPVLEELVIDHIGSCVWTSCPVSVATLKRLTFCCENMKFCGMHEENPNNVSFDTPNLVYLEYAEVIANNYPKVNFDSLVEAKIDIWMTDDQIEEVTLRDNEENCMVGNATDFIFGIRNVRVLYLSADTLEVLTYCCKQIPIFNNLTHLTIESNPKVGWKSIPKMLNNSPNLETLVFQGLLHRDTEEDVAISSSSVKVLKIFISDEKVKKQIEKVKHFMETMPRLEQLVLYYDVKVSSQLQMLSRLASSKCKIHLIPSNLSV
ncbi:putative F-box/LRR-repeat protein At3g59170 [Arabidopsis lyrata subsp. lyrata]|uniref:putative F-box/LRR-repeat protein At3g59170 n=1 Tax=Arabidopsis lyrata subsp. lyrata TaxID=81972 RepID=UPI000A29DF85|nr:putative F-box/LRR-repeat protein At3g59170 [Arabidopsis lyrata subsp. lyrata]|eukprot:XP_020880541.1 putative F-box/LRR-repeat protein At3g59170 [Arabidopsis lyrata subsp. lyrata]